MDTKELYREILNEHNLNPIHKTNMDEPTFCLEGVNPSCGDQITLQMKLGPDGKITDTSFIGSGCAISQASVDMMAELVIGKTKEEALKQKNLSEELKDEINEIVDNKEKKTEEKKIKKTKWIGHKLQARQVRMRENMHLMVCYR